MKDTMKDTRLSLFRNMLEQQGLFAFYLRNESDIQWLTGFDGVFDGEGAFALLLTRDQALLHTDSRYECATKKAAQDSPFTVDVQAVSHAACLFNVLSEQKNTHASNQSMRIGIETSLSLGEYRRLQQEAQKHRSPKLLFPEIDFVETEDLCVNIRAVKDAGELKRLRAAQAITDAAFAYICTYLQPGMTERQVQIELEDYMLRHGASGLAFSSIVAGGPHGASPHAVPSNTRLEAGQCVVFDFGARAQGYCSDMTRVVFLGEPSARMRHAYEVLREANETVEAMLAPGITGAQAHQKAEEILAAGGFAGKMGHGLGHGVGIDIHEQPTLSLRNTNALRAGNVVTVEPGIYLPGEFGMRLEDFGVVTETGFQVFTQSSHEMVII